MTHVREPTRTKITVGDILDMIIEDVERIKCVAVVDNEPLERFHKTSFLQGQEFSLLRLSAQIYERLEKEHGVDS